MRALTFFTWSIAVVSVAAGVTLLGPDRAAACTGVPRTSSVIPRNGATGIPAGTSIFTFGIPAAQVSITANGAPVTIGTETVLAAGNDTIGSSYGQLVERLTPASPFAPGTTVTVTNTGLDGTATVVSTFTIAATSSANPVTNTAPSASALSMWQVEYTGGVDSCTDSDEIGFVSLGYAPAIFSDTPVDDVVHVLSLQSPPSNEDDGDEIDFAYVGATPYVGEPAGTTTQDGTDWYPPYDATEGYCLTIHAYGYTTDVASNDPSPPCGDVNVIFQTAPTPVTSASVSADPDGIPGGVSDNSTPAGSTCTMGHDHRTGNRAPFATLALVAMVSAYRRSRRRHAAP